MCSHSHSVCFMSPIHWMAYKGNLLPFSFLSRSQLPWQASESRVVLYCKVLTSRLGFWLKKKKKKKKGSSLPYREHMVCTCFVIGFYPLAERCYCILSECSLHHFTDPRCCFSFAWVIDWGDVVTRLPRKYSFSSCLLLHVYLKFDLFIFRHASLQQTARWTPDTVLLTSHPCLSSPLSSKPVIMLDAFCYASACSRAAER